MDFYSYYGIEKCTFRKTPSDFVVVYIRDTFSHVLVIDLSEQMVVLFGVLLLQNKYNGGVVNFAQFWAWIGSLPCV